MLEIIKAKYLNDYKIQIEFNDGKSGSIDLEKALWGPVFTPLKNKNKFKSFHLSKTLHTIQWSNDADFAPEFLYQKMIEQNHST